MKPSLYGTSDISHRRGPSYGFVFSSNINDWRNKKNKPKGKIKRKGEKLNQNKQNLK